ncbi:hypothetical protein DFH06DRAFT_1386583 [Mycena polygramma]|nr:hypothetical protein DFH06DRAFT_1386583 [Mycena polygramma]
MSTLEELLTFIQTTLLSIRSLVVCLFVRNREAPPPLASDLEKCLGDIEHGNGPGNGPLDTSTPGAETNIFNKIASSKQSGASQSKIGSKSKLPAVSPLAMVTNVLRVSAPSKTSTKSGSMRENELQALPKPTPLRRMPRYLNLTGAPPVKSLPSVKTSPSGKTAHRGSLVWFATPAVPTLKMDSDSVDLVVRIQRALRTQEDENEDEVANARGLVKRDSVWSGLAPLDAADEEDEDHEEDYGRQLSIQWTSYSPSTPSSDDHLFGCPPFEFSHLPYLQSSGSVLSLQPSSSTDSFNDLLASVDRKHPGTEWRDIIEFSGDNICENEYEQEHEHEQWSEVPLDD